MAKKYTVKDLNKNGKIDGWEQGKYDAINSPTKMLGIIPAKINKTLVKGANNYIVKKYNVKEAVQTASGYPMELGSKEIDSPTNFKTKDAMLMMQSPMRMVGGDPSISMYGDYADPKSSSYVGLPDVTQNQMSENMSEMNQQYQPISKSSSSSDSDAYAALGGGLKKLITPKPDSQAEANQKYRQDKRKAKRQAQGGTKVGNKLRKVFGTGKQNKNL